MIDGFWIVQFEGVQAKGGGVAVLTKGHIFGGDSGFTYTGKYETEQEIVIEADADGFFVSCPALQGCYSQGDTYEEAVENIKDAIKLHIEDRQADGEEIPLVSVSLSTVEIAV